mgnify:CR=1 FL=1
MKAATKVQRMSKALAFEASRAAAKIEIDGYTVSNDRITCDEDRDGSFYPVLYFRCGDEVIAVPDFYIGEEHVSLTGSQGGSYRLDNETVTAE